MLLCGSRLRSCIGGFAKGDGWFRVFNDLGYGCEIAVTRVANDLFGPVFLGAGFVGVGQVLAGDL